MKPITAEDIQNWCVENQCHAHFDSKGQIIAGHDSEVGSKRTPAQFADLIGPRPDDGFAVTLDADGYYSLAEVMQRAFEQASAGKGRERHANALPFDQQPMQTIAAQVGIGFLLGQAFKKAQESQSLPHERGVAEILGAMNYLAGAVIFMERTRAVVPVANDNKPVDVEHQLGTRFMTTTGSQTEGIGMDPGTGIARHG